MRRAVNTIRHTQWNVSYGGVHPFESTIVATVKVDVVARDTLTKLVEGGNKGRALALAREPIPAGHRVATNTTDWPVAGLSGNPPDGYAPSA
ncbi:MAG: hypothetical protein ACI8TX_002314 [Hyphomicrobiaceae bacterium]|jgi:hypothetical protein